MRKKILTLVIAMTMSSVILAACGSSGSYSDSAKCAESAMADYEYESNYAEPAMYDAGAEAKMASGESSISTSEVEQSAVSTNRKLIKYVDLTVETKEFDALTSALSDEIVSLGGYIENMEGSYGSNYNSYRSSKSATIVARVPAANLDTFLNSVGKQSNITYRSERTDDVTLQYVDMDSHKRMLLEEQERLLKFLEEAETIEDIISIESRLTDVKYDLESMESQLRTFDNKVDYSTVTISINEVIDYTEPIEVEKTPVERMKEGFARSVKTIGHGLKEFGIWFVVNIPYFILWAIIAVIILVIVKIVLKLEGKKLEKIKAERAAKAIHKENTQKDNVASSDGIFVKKPEKHNEDNK